MIMNKKKIIAFVSLTSTTLVVGSLYFVSFSKNNNPALLAIASDSWYHYTAVAATENKHGSREFWAKADDYCNTRVFNQPEGTIIETRDFASYESFGTLAFGDDRYVPSLFDQRNGVYPINNGDGTFNYGIYPNSKVTDSSVLTELNSFDDSDIKGNGWYLYDGAYYAKKNTDWYKCEPINWIIMSNNGSGEYLLLASKSTDVHRYDDDSSNYENSEIRSFLNNDMFTKAFYLNSNYVKAGTDKLYVLDKPTMRDFFDAGENYQLRYSYATDWVLADNPAKESFEGKYKVCYWSTTTYDGSQVYCFNLSGTAYSYYSVTKTDYTVRPAMTLKLS